ncbi:hypothetical protein LV716_01265 [Flagellimonas sp. HMM57]|uniref:hypothetical protein n=1 Tax=unclassified Flagellimonas TaxID=2644544 RepID=UPI0013D6432E|nr:MULTISPECIES: hypothetical protein [unclassified Flagellimonas]UII76443.1 hypothetical protein LV716_01265 [Flagellimonas sp. HMM57]
MRKFNTKCKKYKSYCERQVESVSRKLWEVPNTKQKANKLNTMTKQKKSWGLLENPLLYAIFGALAVVISKANANTEEWTSKLDYWLPYIEVVGWCFVVVAAILCFMRIWNKAIEDQDG